MQIGSINLLDILNLELAQITENSPASLKLASQYSGTTFGLVFKQKIYHRPGRRKIARDTAAK